MQDGSNALVQFLPLIFIIFIFYFLLIRPQKKRAEEHRRLIDSVEAGDEVMTGSGIYGTVREVRDDHMLLEIAPGTTVRVARGAIAQRVADDDDAAEDDEPR